MYTDTHENRIYSETGALRSCCNRIINIRIVNKYMHIDASMQ